MTVQDQLGDNNQYYTFLRGNGGAKNKNVVARSEFMTIEQGLCELLWLKIILEDSRIKWKGPSFIFDCDNKSAS